MTEEERAEQIIAEAQRQEAEYFKKRYHRDIAQMDAAYQRQMAEMDAQFERGRRQRAAGRMLYRPGRL